MGVKEGDMQQTERESYTQGECEQITREEVHMEQTGELGEKGTRTEGERGGKRSENRERGTGPRERGRELFGCWSVTSWQHLRPYQGGHGLVPVCTHGDFIVLASTMT